ncbi:MAG: hypothetical protein ACFCBV_12990 [Phycisphaerales bacterium]
MRAFHPRPLLFLALVSLALAVASCDDGQDQPIATIDYAQRLHDDTLARQREVMGENENQWPRYESVMAELESRLDIVKRADSNAFSAAEKSDPENVWAGLGLAIFGMVPHRGAPEDFAAEHARAVAMFEDLRAQGIFDITAELSDLLVTMPPPEDRPFELSTQPFRSTSRQLIRLQNARMHLAGDDEAQLLSGLQEGLTVGRHISWHGSVPEWMTGQLLVRIAVQDFLRALLRQPTLSDDTLARADALIVLEGQTRTAGIEHVIHAIDLTTKDLIQRTYSARGDLHIESHERYFPPGFFDTPPPEEPIDNDDMFAIFGSMYFPSPEEPYDSRKDVTVWFEPLQAMILEPARAKGNDVLPASDETAAFAQTATPHAPLAAGLAPPPRLIFFQRGLDLELTGTRVVLSIERFRLRNGGTLPASLDDLGSLLPVDTRTDPLTGTPWVYEPTPIEADRNGDPLLEGALAWPYTVRSAALPGAEPNARWQSNPKGGMLITAPIQGPKYDEIEQDSGNG